MTASKTTIVSGEPHDAVLNLAEAAELLRVSENDLRALAESGEIPGRRIGRLRRKLVDVIDEHHSDRRGLDGSDLERYIPRRVVRPTRA